MNDAIGPHDPLERVIDALRQPVPVAPGLPERAARRRRRQRVTNVARALLAVAVVAVAGAIARRNLSGKSVTFAITAPMVRSVVLVGDFTDWRTDRVQLQRDESGSWRATIRLRPGQYRFAYLVDRDEWRADAHAASAPDDFGRPTSVLTVAEN